MGMGGGNPNMGMGGGNPNMGMGGGNPNMGMGGGPKLKKEASPEIISLDDTMSKVDTTYLKYC